MTELRTPCGRELGFCLIARFGVRKAEDPRLREFFSRKLRGYQRTLLLLRLARALQVVLRSDSSVAAYDLANAIQAQGDARILDDAAAVEALAAYKGALRQRAAHLTGDAARLMGTGLMAGRALA